MLKIFLFHSEFKTLTYQIFQQIPSGVSYSITLIRESLAVMASPTKIIAEYAKSNRSTCKKCSDSISVNTLRLGLHGKDPRGYDVTKWHHLNCFPSDSLQPIHGSTDNIQGFSSLKSSDQEALEKLTSKCDLESKQGSDHGEKEVEEGNGKKGSKKSKVDKVDKHDKEGEQKKVKVVAEYAKYQSNSLLQCTKAIPSKTLRLGLVSSDRGFDMTKWHHLGCLSTVPLQVDSVDEIDGFTSLKSNHQEALKKLLNGVPLPVEVLKEDEAALDELQSKSKTAKPSIKIITEYAKSSRSSCKKCTEAIPAKSLRLGSISKERGHEVTRWYHPACFPTDSQPSSVDEIDGFSSLEIVDQEALQKIMDECDQLPKEVHKADESTLDEGKGRSSKKLKVAE
ncbi:polynucleotide 3'-phosphatase ZDP-like [Papaver somniferum]|uniref:polynucleotide 3'-phosphatase ZDP-like n=1 Tax=Papaver somniferum TaxID=3469 RepID=UPI000E6FE094|nr:polynucleotide 3'-phosphatase ZDP-like [Papaver somniferum]